MRILLLALAAMPLPAVAQTLAFPGAEGAGMHALGGRGGRVIAVTTLADSGPGSLREAIDARGPRTIVFRVAGTIALLSPLQIDQGRVTIAGQSAPGGGITLRNQPLLISADDVVVRYLRVRLGDEGKVETDAITVNRGARIVLDHVSASWSVDETLSVAGLGKDLSRVPRDVTVQWSIIGESLNNSGHAKGAHGYGTLIRSGFGARISFHHNLWAHHRARMPRPGNYNGEDIDPLGPQVDVRSNLFYNWGAGYSGYNADTANAIGYNFIDNAYIMGPQSEKPIAFDEKDPRARAYFAGNSMNGAVPADPWSLVTGVVAQRQAAALEISRIAADPAEKAAVRILAKAGASRFRDAVDARIVESVRTRGGRLIDSQKDVGGWPELPGGAAEPDGDGDGMPDGWERKHRLNPADAADGNGDADGDGYTNLEEWLAERAG
jgi:hypothetical protein